MRRIFIFFFVVFFVRTTNGQSTNPFTPYCDQLTALLPQIQSSTVNVSCTTPLIQDTQIALHYCTTFMTSSLSPTSTATFLATISGLTAQIQGLYAVCLAGSENETTTTTTTTTTLPPDVRLALLPQFEFIISNLTSLFNVSSASSASSCCLQPIKNDIDFLVSWTQTLKSGILSQSYGLEISYIESLYSNIQQLYSNFTDCQTVGNCCNLTSVLATTTTVATTTVTSTSTTTTTTLDPRTALTAPMQQLLAQLNALLQSVQTYNGTQSGCPPFVVNLTNLISQIQALIANLMSTDFATCSSTLSSLQSQASQEAANWVTYCANDVPTTLAPTTEAPTTITVDPRLALMTSAQQLLANITAFLQSIQSYPGSQTGVPLFVSNATTAVNQTQNLVTNMMIIEFSICSATLTSLQDFFSQLIAAWTSYCANDVPTTLAPTTEAPTTITVDPRLALMTSAQQLLANITAFLQSIQSYPGSQTGVPLFVSNATTAVNQTQNLVANMMIIEFSICSATLTSLQDFFSQLIAAWTSYCANDVPTTLPPTTEAPTTLPPTTEAPTTLQPTTEAPTTEAPTITTIDPRLALMTSAQQLLAQLNALLQSVQTYNGTQSGCPPFVVNLTNLISQIQALIANLMSTDFATCSSTLSSLQSQASQEAANWATYCANDVPTTLAPTTEAPTTLAPTITTIDPRLALMTSAQQLLANITAFLQSIQSYTGSQTGVPSFVSNVTTAVNQTQNLVTNMMTIEFSVCSSTLTSLQDFFSQLIAAWTSYCANDVPTTLPPTTEAPTTLPPTTEAPTTEAQTTEAPTTLPPTTEAPTTLPPTTEAPTTEAPTTEAPTTIDPRLALMTSAQQLLANITAFLQSIQNYTGSQTGVPLFVSNATTAVNQTQNLVTNIMTIEFSICSATLTNLQDFFSQLIAAWASYCANDVPTTLPPTTEAPTTLPPTTEAPTTLPPTTVAPTTLPPTTEAPTTEAPTTEAPTTLPPTTEAPTTLPPTTLAPTTLPPTTLPPTTLAPTTIPPTTLAPTTTTSLKPLNINICSKKYSFLGMAVTACLINGVFTFQQAKDLCAQNGMIQLAMVNGLQWTAFSAFALVALQGDTNFWLNGLHDGTGWYAYYPAPVAIYPGIVSLIQGTPTTGANCLKVFKPAPLKGWTFAANSCAATMSALCQY